MVAGPFLGRRPRLEGAGRAPDPPAYRRRSSRSGSPRPRSGCRVRARAAVRAIPSARAPSGQPRELAAGSPGGRRRARHAATAWPAGDPPDERNRRARKIQRVAVAIDDDLRDVRVPSSAGSSMRRRSVDISSGGSRRSGSASSIIAGSMSGSSPCTLTMMSQARSTRTSAIRSVPLWCDGDVMHASPPNARPRSRSARHRWRRERRDGSGGGGTPVHMLDHRTAVDVREGLARQPRGLVSGRNDGDNRDGSVPPKTRRMKQGARQILPQMLTVTRDARLAQMRLQVTARRPSADHIGTTRRDHETFVD